MCREGRAGGALTRVFIFFRAYSDRIKRMLIRHLKCLATYRCCNNLQFLLTEYICLFTDLRNTQKENGPRGTNPR